MRRWLIGLAVVAGVGLAIGAVRIIRPLGASSFLSGGRDAAKSSASQGGDGGLLNLTPVQALFFFWQDTKALERDKRGLGPAGFRRRAVEKTSAFLELDEAATSAFASAVDQTLADLQKARRRMESEQKADDGGDAEYLRSQWSRFTRDQDAAMNQVCSLLGETRRHRLFRRDCAKWILYLDYHVQVRP